MLTINAGWLDIDPWWKRYSESQREELLALRERFATLDACWEESGCPFDQDPLAVDWTRRNPQVGPLRAQEENWSQWLSHLLRASSGAFTQALFGETFDSEPSEVRREQAISDEKMPNRRIDIIAEWVDQGVSIEVKINDEAYEKTLQAAALVEKHHSRALNWTHFLLLPEAKLAALEETFDSRLDTSTKRPVIHPEDTDEVAVTVLYWRDVARELRRILLQESEYVPHDTASAYLFVTLIEQKILDFIPRPVVSRYLESAASVSDIDRLQSIEPGEQLAYLEAVGGTNHG